MAKIKNTDILRVMEGLHCSREEAIQVIKDDKKIDRGERMPFDLDKTAEREALNTAHKGKTFNLPSKPRKANPTKGAIIAELVEVLKNSDKNAYSGVKIVNKEREIEFFIENTSFSLTLIQHRAPKTPK